MITLLQTQFLKRYITLQTLPIPIAGAFAGVSVDRSWFNLSYDSSDEPYLTITPAGVKQFWIGVKHWGIKKVMGKPIPTPSLNPPPNDGGSAPPIKLAA